MKPALRILTVSLALLICSINLSAQWKGSAELSLGAGGMAKVDPEEDGLGHYYVSGAFSLGHTAPKFQWNTSLNCVFETKETEVDRISITGMKTEKPSFKAVVKFSEQKPLNIRWRSEAGFTPTTAQRYSAWVQYRYRSNPSKNQNVDIGGDLDLEIDDIDLSMFKVNIEDQKLTEHVVVAGARSQLQLGSPRKVLFSELTGTVSILDRTSDWDIQSATSNDSDDMDYSAHIYRINSASTDPSFSLSIHLRDSLLTGETKFVFNPGFRVLLGNNLNRNSGATNTGESDQWRDSVRLRENFNFLEVRGEPFVAGDLRREKLHIAFDYALQLYSKRLNDDTHTQEIGLQQPRPVGSSNVEWLISNNHRISFGNTISVQYPSYLQICWYDRPGEYVNQLIRGNINLLPTSTVSFRTNYAFTQRRFGASVSASIGKKNDEIDRTYVNETIEGRKYKVFTWVNAADSWIGTASARMTWTDSRFSAGMSADYRQNLRRVRATGEEKRSFDWNFKTNAAVDLGKGWNIGADLTFQSKVATFFTMFSQYCTLNASISKSFKHFTLFLNGRDLLDTELTTEYLSEDESECWQETALNNRRLVILGARWIF
ncbi:MAG: outer membrane beta-barrel protein [Bacteroidales bacterium]|nr:outer membrane beta-barrel protein [Bacteroidales bacterium]